MNDVQLRDYEKIAKDIKYIVEGLPGECTEDNIINTVKTMAPIYSLSVVEVEKVSSLILEMTRHRLSEGVSIHAPHENWYYSRKSQIDLSLSDRHLEYLRKQGLSQDVVNKLDNCTDEIVNYLGDPTKGAFFRRGLVMGDVQSGKTNTYMLICNKAADAGYKVIIILTSNIGSLRKQTQQRADSALIGKDSDRNRDDRWNLIGVGEINPDPIVQAFTSYSGDFSAVVANTNGFQVRGLNMDPCVLVVKKNKDILHNLSEWLRDRNMIGDSKINQSLLIIDDEADYASVNTKKEDQSKINEHITTILSMFTRASYCGFTATPFANIFINPDNERDLFPSDFIYCLGSADNYIGPDRLFPSDDPEDDDGVDFPRMIQIIKFDRAKKKKDRQNEGLNELKLKHRKDDVMKGIPTSLNEALNEFLLTCSIRDLRGMKKSHMSMLINMSRFTDVQENIRTQVDDRFKSILRSVRVYSHDPAVALSDPYIYDMKRIFDEQYYDCGFSWSEVLASLETAILPIIVRTINRNNGAESIDYKSYPEGLRIIAIGGDSLSRGLTLEGLVVSYFYRRSQTYDTLMQMGRWFGYRDGYVDLCRVWMTQESVEWYTYINRATEKLKDQFYIMSRKKRSPSEFGFIVENDLTTLQITGRAKLYSAPGTVEIPISNSGKMIDTVYFYVDPENVSINHKVVNEAIASIETTEGIMPWHNKNTGNYVWKDVPKKYVEMLIKGYSNPSQNDAFNTRVILEQISNSDISCLDYWDVAVVSRTSPAGASGPFAFRDNSINMVARTALDFESDGDDDDYHKVARMTKGMFITATDMAEGLYKENGEFDSDLKSKLAKQYLEEAARDDDSKKRKHAPAVAYLVQDHTKKRPLLLIYFVDLTKKGESSSLDVKNKIDALGGLPPVALAIGYPSSNELGDSKGKKTLRYRPNQIYARYGNEDLDEADI